MSQTGPGRKLRRKTGSRVALLRGLATALIRHEQIRTTFPKGKECARLADHLISVSKIGDLSARRLVARDIHDPEVLAKLFDVLATRYKSREGGYTQVFKIEPRQGDNAPMALVKLIA